MPLDFSYGAVTLFGPSFQMVLLSPCIPLSRQSYYPKSSLGLGSFPFARHYLGNHSYFLFLQVLRCFSSLRLAPMSYAFTHRYAASRCMGSPIRISTVLSVLTAPRRVSPFAASFFASQCPGIHRTPFFALPSFLVLSFGVVIFFLDFFSERPSRSSRILDLSFLLSSLLRYYPVFSVLSSSVSHSKLNSFSELTCLAFSLERR